MKVVEGYTDNDVTRFDADGEWEKDRQFVTALARGLEILRCFRPNERYIGVTELSHRVGIPKPSVSRLAGTLVKLGYLSFSRDLGKYSLGPGVLSLGYAMLSNLGIRQIVRPMLEELAEYSRASVSIGVRDRLSMVYIETVRSSAPVGLRRNIGSRLPMAMTALGRAYLAGLPEQERDFLVGQIRLHYEDDWTTLRTGIERGLREYAEQGFCTVVSEWEKDISAVAVPFTDADGVHMAFSCGGPAFLLSREKLEKDLGPRLAGIIKRIGGGSRS